MKRIKSFMILLCAFALLSCEKNKLTMNIENSYNLETNNSNESKSDDLIQEDRSLEETDKSNFPNKGKVLIEKSKFLFSEDFDKIVNGGRKLYLYYETDSLDGMTFINVFQYLLEDGKESKVLGGFDFDRGFYGLDYVSLKLTGDSNKESDFFKSHLLGFSISLIDQPFEIFGIARATDGTLYETEIMHRFQINSDSLSIEKWTPSFW